jgi:hypothetical protein
MYYIRNKKQEVNARNCVSLRKIVEMRYQDFYTELGKLLYAIAKVDGKVGAREFTALKKIVKEELLQLENSHDQFGTDNAYYVEMEFDFLEGNFGDPEQAFTSFLDFIEEHKSAITPELKGLIAHLSAKIASSEMGIHPKEQLYLRRLEEKIKG